MTSTSQKTIDFLIAHKTLMCSHLEKVTALIGSPQLQMVAQEHRQFKDRKIEAGFNLFLLISDTYRRENFHSDILKALLDPAEKHKQGNLYLFEFLNYLNRIAGTKLDIKFSDYTSAKVYRERGRVDVLIQDDVSKHAIIIENKINRAGDMQRQLPRYTENLINEGYYVDAIVYLLLNYHLSPNTNGWSQQDVDLVKPKLLCIPANNEQNNDLVNGWLAPCIAATTEPETIFIIKQYQTLIKWIGKTAMDKQIMEQFYGQMKQAENFATAQSVKSMLSDLPTYRIERIVDHFKNNCYPFESVWNWQNKAAVFESFRYKNSSLTIDVLTEDEAYHLQVFSREVGALSSLQILQELDEADKFHPKGERLQYSFLFPGEEEMLYQYLESFRQKLERLLPAPVSSL